MTHIRQQETPEEAAERIYPENWQSIMDGQHDSNSYERTAFINGAKWQQEQDRWKTVYEETPPIHTELLVKSPEGIIHLASWRESYNIFTCQCKGQSSLDWQWKKI